MTSDNKQYSVPDAFVGVTVATMLFAILIMIFAMYKKCVGHDETATSDSASTISDSAWRVEDIEGLASGSDAVAAKHRKRLRKLDQIAPVKSLHDWRAEKQLIHVETFATVSTKLICAICLDLIDEKEQIRELQCGHVYHSACLNLWVERGHHDCPLCKFDILGLRETPKTQQSGPVDVNIEDPQRPSATPAPLTLPRHPEDAHIVVISNRQPGAEPVPESQAFPPPPGTDTRNGHAG